MRTAEERVARLHSRAAELQKQQTRRSLASLGGVSMILTVVLSALIVRTGGSSHTLAGDEFTGSSLLSDGAGGYVLAAVIAFFVGVTVTAVIFRTRR